MFPGWLFPGIVNTLAPGAGGNRRRLPFCLSARVQAVQQQPGTEEKKPKQEDAAVLLCPRCMYIRSPFNPSIRAQMRKKKERKKETSPGMFAGEGVGIPE